MSPTLRFSKLVPSRHALRAPSDAASVEEESDDEELIIEDSIEEDSSDVDSSDSEEHSSEDESSEEASSESAGHLVEGDGKQSWAMNLPSQILMARDRTAILDQPIAFYRAILITKSQAICTTRAISLS